MEARARGSAVAFAPVDGPALVDVAASPSSTAPATELQLAVRVRPDVTEQVHDQLRVHLTSCAERQELDPPGCPWGISRILLGVRDVRWTMLRQPVIEVVPVDDPGPSNSPATARTTEPGRVAVTSTAYVAAGGDRDTFTEELPIQVAGGVDVDPSDSSRVIWHG